MCDVTDLRMDDYDKKRLNQDKGMISESQNMIYFIKSDLENITYPS